MHPILTRIPRYGLRSVTAGALALAGVLGLSSPAAAAVTPWAQGNPVYTAPSARPAELGVVYQGTWNLMSATQRGKVLDELAATGVRWVTLDLGWKSLQPSGPGAYSMGDVAEWDRQITEVRSRGLKVMAIFQGAPRWASGTTNRGGRPKDPRAYANAAAWVAKRYNGSSVSSTLRIDAIQLWNEPNLAEYWAPEPATTRVSSFATMIKTAGAAVKSANPNMKVIAAGVSSVDVAWYEQFYKTAGVIGTYDAVGVHPYQSPGDATPETYDTRFGQYYMRHVRALDALMASKKDPARIWATEFGWSTHANSSSTPGWARGVSEAQQADYLLRSMSVLAATPRVQAAFWYSSITTSTGDVQFDNYGLLRRDYSRKPVYYALKCAAARVCGPTTATSVAVTAKNLLPAGSTWAYHDTNQDLGTSWRSPSYSHTSWARGRGQLGFGDGDEVTRLPSGARSTRPTTTYFRSTFDAGSSISGFKSLRLRALVDDGAAVYLNGTPIWRTRLSSTATHGTRATSVVGGEAERVWITVDVPATALKAGANVLAAEVHQYAATSSDLSFDLALEARS